MSGSIASQFAIAFAILLLPNMAKADSGLPEGKGKDVVETTCTECHSLKRIMAQRLDEEGWNGILRELLETGASINPGDMKVIVQYLAKNFGPDSPRKVNINKAEAAEIANILQLTDSEADAIVQYRAQNGEFKDFQDLQKVKGLAGKIDAKKALIEF